MRYLLDTHSFLWFIAGHSNLSDTARQIIEKQEHSIYVSMASLWEIAIKSSLGKLQLSLPFEDLIPDQLARNHLELLPITFPHLIVLTPLAFHHRDPFDRLLIAQAMTESLPLITKDSMFSRYEIPIVW